MKHPAILFVPLLAGCCWTAKRTCFPKCPPPTVVKLEKTCELPPPLKLPAVKRQDQPCPEKTVCFGEKDAGLIAYRESVLKSWIREVRIRCGKPPASQPASRPSR